MELYQKMIPVIIKCQKKTPQFLFMFSNLSSAWFFLIFFLNVNHPLWQPAEERWISHITFGLDVKSMLLHTSRSCDKVTDTKKWVERTLEWLEKCRMEKWVCFIGWGWIGGKTPVSSTVEKSMVPPEQRNLTGQLSCWLPWYASWKLSESKVELDSVILLSTQWYDYRGVHSHCRFHVLNPNSIGCAGRNATLIQYPLPTLYWTLHSQLPTGIHALIHVILWQC